MRCKNWVLGTSQRDMQIFSLVFNLRKQSDQNISHGLLVLFSFVSKSGNVCMNWVHYLHF